MEFKKVLLFKGNYNPTVKSAIELNQDNPIFV
jgi:hypothetical protein